MSWCVPGAAVTWNSGATLDEVQNDRRDKTVDLVIKLVDDNIEVPGDQNDVEVVGLPFGERKSS